MQLYLHYITLHYIYKLMHSPKLHRDVDGGDVKLRRRLVIDLRGIAVAVDVLTPRRRPLLVFLVEHGDVAAQVPAALRVLLHDERAPEEVALHSTCTAERCPRRNDEMALEVAVVGHAPMSEPKVARQDVQLLALATRSRRRGRALRWWQMKGAR